MLKEGVRLDRVRGGRQKYRRQLTAPIASTAVVQPTLQSVHLQQPSVMASNGNSSVHHHHHHHLHNTASASLIHHHHHQQQPLNNKITASGSTHHHHLYHQQQLGSVPHQVCLNGSNGTITATSLHNNQHQHHLLHNSGVGTGNWNNNNDDIGYVKQELQQQSCCNGTAFDAFKECGEFYHLLNI